jgi:hypothetical protein
MIESLFFFMAKLLGVLAILIAIVVGTFWTIDFLDARDRKRRDAVDRKRKLGSNFQKLK